MSKVMKIALIILLVLILAVIGIGVYVLTSVRADAVETVEKPIDLSRLAPSRRADSTASVKLP